MIKKIKCFTIILGILLSMLIIPDFVHADENIDLILTNTTNSDSVTNSNTLGCKPISIIYVNGQFLTPGSFDSYI